MALVEAAGTARLVGALSNGSGGELSAFDLLERLTPTRLDPTSGRLLSREVCATAIGPSRLRSQDATPERGKASSETTKMNPPSARHSMRRPWPGVTASTSQSTRRAHRNLRLFETLMMHSLLLVSISRRFLWARRVDWLVDAET